MKGEGRGVTTWARPPFTGRGQAREKKQRKAAIGRRITSESSLAAGLYLGSTEEREGKGAERGPPRRRSDKKEGKKKRRSLQTESSTGGSRGSQSINLINTSTTWHDERNVGGSPALRKGMGRLRHLKRGHRVEGLLGTRTRRMNKNGGKDRRCTRPRGKRTKSMTEKRKKTRGMSKSGSSVHAPTFDEQERGEERGLMSLIINEGLRGTSSDHKQGRTPNRS